MKLNAKQLRKGLGIRGQGMIKRNEIYIILDNVLDTYNIGSIFRLADAVAANKVILTGGSTTPPNPRIKKASINTTEVVSWEYVESASAAIKNLQLQVENLQVVAVEQSKNSVPYDKFNYQLPICLLVGHETDGISQEVLDLCDGVVELPMYGVNISLNVMVSLAVVLYSILSKTNDKK